MEPTQYIAMVNCFNDATKDNLKRIHFGANDISEGSNIDVNNRLFGLNAMKSRGLSPLCDEIKNAREFNLQVEPIFDSYQGEGDPMAHHKDFEMKFKLKF